MGAYAHARTIFGDDANRLTLLSNKQSDDDVVSSFAYSVDKTGNRTKLTLANGDYAEYLYDQTYQLTREHRKDSQNATLYYNNFFYDPAGNRTRLEYNDGTGTTTTSYLYNSGDQLTRESVGETNTTYLYDANGNLTKKDDGTNVHAYGYDWLNLMTSYDGPGTSNDATYTYDAEARRVTKSVNGSKTAYVYDFWNVVADYDGSNNLQATYVTPGLDDNLTVTRNGSTYFYIQDGLGSIGDLLDGDQAVQNAYDYEAFGKAYGIPTENVANRYRFTGREPDSETGLQYTRARWYAPNLGRWTSRDPMGYTHRTNLYTYAHNCPTGWTDRYGTEEQQPKPFGAECWETTVTNVLKCEYKLLSMKGSRCPDQKTIDKADPCQKVKEELLKKDKKKQPVVQKQDCPPGEACVNKHPVEKGFQFTIKKPFVLKPIVVLGVDIGGYDCTVEVEATLEVEGKGWVGCCEKPGEKAQ